MVRGVVTAIVVAACTILLPHGNAGETVQDPQPSPTGNPRREAPKATLTAEQIKSLLKDYRKVTALSIEYRQNMRPGIIPGDTMQPGVHRIIVAKSPCFLYHDSSHETKTIDWRDDPYRQVAYFNRSHMVVAYTLKRSFFQRSYGANLPLQGTLATEFFFISTGIWPLSGRQPPRPNDVPHIFREVAESAGHNRVRDKLDYVAGAWCHVLFSEGKDYLWIDATRGARLVKREIRNPPSGVLRSRYTLAAHKEILPGIWCPTVIRNEQFDFNAATPAEQQRLVIDSDAVVSKISTSVADESIFTFHPGPGWLELNAEDVTVMPVQAVPGGESQLEDLSAWIKRCRIRSASKTSIHAHYTAVAGILLVCIAVFEVVLWTKRSSGRL